MPFRLGTVFMFINIFKVYGVVPTITQGGSPEPDIHLLGQAGWLINELQEPACLHSPSAAVTGSVHALGSTQLTGTPSHERLHSRDDLYGPGDLSFGLLPEQW